MKIIPVALAGMMVLATAACSGMSNKEQRILSGGAIGAGTGAAVGAVTGGSPVTGAILGGALGAGAGYLYHKDKD